MDCIIATSGKFLFSIRLHLSFNCIIILTFRHFALIVSLRLIRILILRIFYVIIIWRLRWWTNWILLSVILFVINWLSWLVVRLGENLFLKFGHHSIRYFVLCRFWFRILLMSIIIRWVTLLHNIKLSLRISSFVFA